MADVTGLHMSWKSLGWYAAAVFITVAMLTGALVLLKFAGVLPASGQDQTAGLGLLGGLIGTVFVVGGLVIALAAVVTLVSVDDRVDRRVTALQPTLEQRADLQIEAYLTMVGATEKPWPEAITQTQQALKLYPGLSNARRRLGLYLAEVLSAHFAAQRGSAMPDESIDISEVQWWLRQACEHGEDTDGRCSAALALVAAFQGNWRVVLDRLARLPAADVRSEALTHYLADSTHIAIFAGACGTDVAKMRDLGGLLGLAMPIDFAGFSAWVEKQAAEVADEAANVEGGVSSRRLEIYVTGKPGAWDEPTRNAFPVVLRLELEARPYAPMLVATYVTNAKTIVNLPAAFVEKPRFVLNSPLLHQEPSEVIAPIDPLCWIIALPS